MVWDPTLTALRQVLVELYPTEDDARQAALTALLDTQRIGFSATAINNWTNILLIADTNEQVEDLIRVALEQFPRSTKLKTAIEAYRTGKSDETRSPSLEIPEPATVDPRSLREAMVKAFKTEELELLCSNIQASLARDGIKLDLSLEIVGGNTKPMQVLELIGYLDRRGHLAYLIQAVRQERPGLI